MSARKSGRGGKSWEVEKAEDQAGLKASDLEKEHSGEKKNPSDEAEGRVLGRPAEAGHRGRQPPPLPLPQRTRGGGAKWCRGWASLATMGTHGDQRLALGLTGQTSANVPSARMVSLPRTLSSLHGLHCSIYPV